MIKKNFLKLNLFLVLFFCTKISLASLQIVGAGSSFIYPILSLWTKMYKKNNEIEINYQPIGSGGGLHQIYHGIINFAASDMPLSKKEIQKKLILQFPGIIGGIVLVVNLHGILSNQMVLDGCTISEIYNGKIQYWDNPKIIHLNPDLKIPHHRIITIHRADGSGTTFNFTYYLSQINKNWKKNIGYNTTVQWPGIGIGAKGNAGVSSQILHIPYSIGYVEYAFAKQNNLTILKIKNKSGEIVQANKFTFSNAVKKANWLSGFNTLLINQKGLHIWPIVAVTFILIPKKENINIIKIILNFFKWTHTNNAKFMADKLDYIAIPNNIAKLIEKNWDNFLYLKNKKY